MKKKSLDLTKVLLLLTILLVMILSVDIVSVYYPVISEQLTVVSYLLQIGLIMVFFFQYRIKIELFKKVDLLLLVYSFIVGTIVVLLGSCLENIFICFIPKMQSSDESSANFLAFMAIYAALIAPPIEEIEFRYLLFDAIFEETNRVKFAIIISAIIFMLFHTGGINLGSFILGIISAILYYRTRNLIYSIAMHFSGNLLCSFLLVFSLNETDNRGTNEILTYNDILFSIIISFVIGSILFLMLIGMIVLIFVKSKKAFSKMNKNIEVINTVKCFEKRNLILIILYFVLYGIDWMICY